MDEKHEKQGIDIKMKLLFSKERGMSAPSLSSKLDKIKEL